LHGDFVTTDAGTGIVHIAPGFGEDDQILCKNNGIPTLCPVDEGGKFTSEMFDLEGLSIKGKQVFETNDDIIKYLKIDGSWLKTEQYLHDYPHCWRTDTPLIYKAVPSWYVQVTKIKDQMVKNNQEINWIPGNIKDGQFGKWLEGARDWSISRNRFWGCPVPVWKSNDPSFPRIDVYGSLEDMKKDFGRLPMDEKGEVNLHRPFIDDLTRSNPDDPSGKSKMVRVTDVLDCWFESGSMPFAQNHYPFENKHHFEENFPADFITEYLAQTRGWFYTLMVLSTALFNRPPFKNVICHGTILDEKSQKLSKRLKNYVDPMEIFSQVGSDAMRFYMISQPVMKGQELRIDKEGKAIKDTLRLAIKPLMNAYNFFCLYANSDGVKAQKITSSSQISNLMDRYILAKLKSAVLGIDAAMQDYDTPTACAEFVAFFEVLNNWYIRRSRNRFWKREIDEDKMQAYNTLYTVLLTMCEAAAPLLPFTTEKVWKDLQ
ncbi:MAG: isoleucyl-tRNA synthetase, partial [Rickettsiales bacterium]